MELHGWQWESSPAGIHAHGWNQLHPGMVDGRCAWRGLGEVNISGKGGPGSGWAGWGGGRGVEALAGWRVAGESVPSASLD